MEFIFNYLVPQLKLKIINSDVAETTSDAWYLLRKALLLPNFDFKPLVQVAVLDQLDNPNPSPECLSFISLLLKSKNLSNSFFKDNVIKHLNFCLNIVRNFNFDARVKIECLNFLLFFINIEETFVIDNVSAGRELISNMDLELIYMNHLDDFEATVRRTALECLIKLYCVSVTIESKKYEKLASLLKDDDENVRVSGLKLLWTIISSFPNTRLISSNGEGLRLVDDAFIRFCDILNDNSVAVRVQACALLGTFRGVKQNYLLQTLSKKHLTESRVKRNSYKNMDIEYEGVEGLNLLDASACGAFIHGLEDEYEEVRNATVDSICELCLTSREFTLVAVNFLLDMFNDESESIRVNAINSLKKISSNNVTSLQNSGISKNVFNQLYFDYEQLQSIVLIIQDSKADCRYLSHRMLGNFKITTTAGLIYLCQSLFKNLSRYPEDKNSIYLLLGDLGKQHPSMIESLVPTLLNLDERFLAQEIAMEDPKHLANLIMIFNAASVRSDIYKILPTFTFKHLVYLRNKFPECLPHDNELNKPLLYHSCSILEYLKATWDQLISDLELLKLNKSENEMGKYFEKKFFEFKNISMMDKKVFGTALFLSELMSLFSLICEIKGRVGYQKHFLKSCQTYAIIILKNIYYLKTNFIGLHLKRHFLSLIDNCKVFLNLILMLSFLYFDLKKDFNTAYVAMFQRINLVKGCYIDLENANYWENLYHEMSELLNIGKSGQTTLILDFVKNFPLPNLEFPGMLKRATSTLKLCSENIRNLDDEGSLILPTNIPISFKFNIEIKYAQNVNPSAIKIKAKFTDNSILLFKVPPSDIYIIDSFTYKITSTIRITLPAADGFYLEFSVINTFIPDFLHDFTILNFKNFEKSDIVCMDSEQLVGTEEKTGLIWSEIPSEGSSFLKVHPKKTF